MGPPKQSSEVTVKSVSKSSSSSSAKPLPSLPRASTDKGSRSSGANRSEVVYMNKVIKEDRTEKGRAIIAVVKSEDLSELERKSKDSKWKFWKGKSIVKVTTPDTLQKAISSMQMEKEKNYRHLTLLVSKDLEELKFDVSPMVQSLSVFRHDNNPVPAGSLLIDGSSTYCGIRLDEWQARRHKKHAIYLGQGVGIKIETLNALPATDPEPAPDPLAYDEYGTVATTPQRKRTPTPVWGAYTLSMSNTEKGEVYELFNSLYHNPEQDAHKPWFERWQGPISTILGILTGSKPVTSLRATAGGFYVEYHFGAALMTLGGAGMQTAVTSAAGPAMMLGLGAAAAVYYIPWEAVFKWFWAVFRNLYRQFLSMWEKLMKWLSDKIKGSGTSGGNQPSMPQPMDFR